MDSDYNIDEEKKRNIIINNLNDSDSIRRYFSNLRNEIRRLYSRIDEVNTSSQIDDELMRMLDRPELNSLKESVTSLFSSLQSIQKMRNEYIFLFDIVFFNLEELALRSLPEVQSSETLTSSKIDSQVLDKKIREVVTEYLSKDEQEGCPNCNYLIPRDSNFCNKCGKEL